jgi:phosphopantothenoylcysteine decarboxylase / phosphopantothenate---cysteine ligase
MKILVGISGSIGVLGIHSYLINLQAEEAVEELRIIMTPTAARFLSPQALEALLRCPVFVDPWSDRSPTYSPPELIKGIDLYLVAPASATTLSRCANGSGENLLAHCYLSHTGPVAFAPSMELEMWNHPAVLRNFERLKGDGAFILPAGAGYSAATGKIQKGSICSYQEMWPLLKSLVQDTRPT